MQSPIASILHRDTIAALVGQRTYERGESCFRGGRVLNIDGATGQLRGTVRPTEGERAPDFVRIWSKDDGLAYSCSCPVGKELKFCKHGVALALAYMESEQRAAESRLEILQRALAGLPADALAQHLVMAAKDDIRLQAVLAGICIELMP